MSYQRYAISNASGFTLLELMISLVLMSLILMLLFSGLDLGSRSWQKSVEKAGRMSGEQLTFDYLRRTLSGMLNQRVGEEGKRESLFSGTHHSLRWVGPTASQAGVGGASLFRLELVVDGEEKYLLLRRWLYHPEILEQASVEGNDWRDPLDGDWRSDNEQVSGLPYSEHQLLSGVIDIELDYYGSQQRGIPAEWQTEWKVLKKLPRLIRLRLHYPDRVTPPLVVAMTGRWG
ncbi:MAG: prepilin-type N-terminal cleavage/methylation domain-containing protein [Candidatus Thiodiazotropha sp. (ex Rostrolucina anterorostrata)]|nr:prepilin-type N-terminal cleavage/methylation domain-containing protein [Candidatus Thiodiazotropha sp. (ex Rostrolucina anterorostrata)]